MIEFRNVDFSYGERPIIKNASFTINDREAVVIMGPSGSGKSTILRLILGLECPQAGEIIIDDQNICFMKEKEKQEIRKKIGMVFQDGALFDSLSVWENVGYYLLEHTKEPIDKIGEKAIQMLGFVGLDAEEVDSLPRPPIPTRRYFRRQGLPNTPVFHHPQSVIHGIEVETLPAGHRLAVEK